MSPNILLDRFGTKIPMYHLSADECGEWVQKRTTVDEKPASEIFCRMFSDSIRELLHNSAIHSFRDTDTAVEYSIKITDGILVFEISNECTKSNYTKAVNEVTKYLSEDDPSEYFDKKIDKNDYKGSGLALALHRLRNYIAATTIEEWNGRLTIKIRMNIEYVD